MIKTDESALICDLAETYGIYDYGSLPITLVATLSVGLRDNSRIKMKLSGMECTTEIYLLSAILDSINLILWSRTKDGQKGKNRPKSVIKTITKQSEESAYMTFDSPESFEAMRAKIIKKGAGQGG